ncbi:MAG: hypothetical protein GY866_04820 [Proteobacteria bacterium]|nr:hypothetical protein [Pseudomonadota bacterium]
MKRNGPRNSESRRLVGRWVGVYSAARVPGVFSFLAQGTGRRNLVKRGRNGN